ncbi:MULTISPECIES: ATP-binding protein [unclassified Stenotrophomonas]|uniref:ATP-binding protein n=1 Tax=unclassified Stenotrophomonas TaxID=196198 RepID=UPI000D164C77|nr:MULTISPECIES: ATP-binding protein [unclassified Stenotrophomonas]PTA71742.1 two-component sensor histidine kinase [Stenotrophomonas sp. Nf1]PTA79551.1 two-component sensor histidine kinase [Stenotrophomonas sp. Nf4]
MKRLFLRLWLLVGASFLITLLLINLIFDRIYLPTQQRIFAEQVRGQLYALRQGLQGKDEAAQQQQLAQWQPHYGIALALLPAPPPISAEEQQQLQRNGMIARQKFEIVWAPLEPAQPDGRWLQLHLPGEPPTSLYLTLVAYSLMLALFGLCLYAWSRVLWRDLDALRVHADRIGAGDLQARAQVSPRSQIRVIVEHSNRMAARVAELVQRQRDLTHAISHELRTPIARVAFGLDLLQDSDDRKRRERLAQGLHGDLAELNRLVSELLAYERLEHPSEGEPLQRIEANDWLQACLADARRDAERAGLVLRVQPSALPRVDAEPRLLQLALSNLVGNALRHARSQVEVSLVGVDGRACLRVDDDGPGIAEADREKVVRPFTRLDDSRSRDTGGFGLGLAIVSRIALRHHGELRIGRATLGGARLEMHWPLAAS